MDPGTRDYYRKIYRNEKKNLNPYLKLISAVGNEFMIWKLKNIILINS